MPTQKPTPTDIPEWPHGAAAEFVNPPAARVRASRPLAERHDETPEHD